jgi:hypothetical protein
MLDKAPPGPIETKWGVGFRNYSECLEYIRSKNIKAPEGGVAVPLRYTVYEQPSYSIVSSNALWRETDRLVTAVERSGPSPQPPLVSCARRTCSPRRRRKS